MEYLTFILLIMFLVFLLFVIARIEKGTKNKWRKSAYDLLEAETPDQEELLKTIKHLRLYGGRIRKDKEFMQLISRLQDRLASIEEEQR
jgi:hypothetical protein